MSAPYYNFFQEVTIDNDLNADFLYGDGSNISGLDLTNIAVGGNSFANTVQFANSSLSFFTDGPVGVNGGLPAAGVDMAIGSSVVIDSDSADIRLNVQSGNVMADYFVGDASRMTALTGASGGSYGSASAVPTIAVSANGRISSIGSATITLASATAGGATTTASIQTGGLTTTDSVGVSNTNSLAYDLSVSDKMFVDADGSNVVVVDGNVSATYYYGDGSFLEGVASVDTLADVTARGNTTSEVVQFTGATGFITTNGVGVANSAPAHTLSVGDTFYVDKDGANTVVAAANISAGYYHGDGTHLINTTDVSDATYGDALTIPQITITDGRVTGITEVAARESNVTTAVQNQVAYYKDNAYTVGGNAGLTFDGTTMTLDGDINVSGNLFVTGNTHVSNNIVFEDSMIEIGNSAATNIDRAVVFHRDGLSNIAMAYHGQGSYANIFTISRTTSSAYNSTITPSGILDVQLFGGLLTQNNLVVGSESQFIVDEENSRVGIANAAPGHALSISDTFYVDAATGDVTTAGSFVGDASSLTSVGDVVSATVGGSSNAAVSVTFDAEGRITGSGSQTLSLNNIALTNADISDTALVLSNTLAMRTTGSVGINNGNPAHDLVVGSGGEFFIDADSSNIVANVIGNVNANYYFGDGTYLQGVSSVDTLDDVISRSNATANTIVFQTDGGVNYTNNVLATSDSTTAGILIGNSGSLGTTQNAIVINASGASVTAAQNDSTYISPVRTEDVAGNVLSYTSAGELVQSGIAIDAPKAVSLHDQKLFVSATKSCSAAGSTNVAKLTFPASKASLIKVDALVNDGTNASAHHAEFLVASVSGGGITSTQIVGFGSNNIVGAGGTPVTGVTLTDAGSGILDVNATLGAGTTQTVSFTVEASAIAGVTLSSLP